MGFEAILFEYPEGWITSDPLSVQHLRCLETIEEAARQLGLGFSTKTGPRMADLAPRYAAEGELLVSAHTVGVASNVVRLKESYLPGYYYFDRTGYSGWAELACSAKLQQDAKSYECHDARELLQRARLEKQEFNTSKYPQNAKVASDALTRLKPYVFLALQTTDDIVARLAGITQFRLACLLAEKTRESGTMLVVKRHPYCTDRNVEMFLSQLCRKYKNLKISDASVNELISNARLVATVNSGVGFEALLMGVPVITAGRSDYATVTSNIVEESCFGQMDLTSVACDNQTIDRFLCYYLGEYCLRVGDVGGAQRLISKWFNRDYASMLDIADIKLSLYAEIQAYVSELEKLRRGQITATAAEVAENVEVNSDPRRLIARLINLGRNV